MRGNAQFIWELGGGKAALLHYGVLKGARIDLVDGDHATPGPPSLQPQPQPHTHTHLLHTFFFSGHLMQPPGL